MRICSGKYEKGMKAKHVRIGKDVKFSDALTFFSSDRGSLNEAYSGDIIGLHQARAEYFVLMGRPDQATRQLNYALQTPGIDAATGARLKQRIAEIQQWKEAMNFK